MNKYQEALGFLKESAYENYFRQHVQTHEERVTIFKSSEYLQELVDKATPKKLKGWRVGKLLPNRGIEFNCPVCNSIYNERVNFCSNCGQAIDWGKR
nr:MAG TPA: PROTEIN/RNA Complex, archaeal, ribosomal, 50S, protein.0A [Caudoviricetes sp.]